MQNICQDFAIWLPTLRYWLPKNSIHEYESVTMVKCSDEIWNTFFIFDGKTVVIIHYVYIPVPKETVRHFQWFYAITISRY